MLLFLIAILVLIYVYAYYIYQQSDYKDKSGYTFSQMLRSKGILGEYRSYYRINLLPVEKKMLTNVYIPIGDGKLTEIDVLMICTKGIYVIEVKNYRGWIFGSEDQRMWTQTFKGGKKSQFYNPIWQNRGHLKALQEFLSIDQKTILKSWIVMGRNCEMRKKIETQDAHLIYEQGIRTRMAQEISNSPD